MTEQTTKAILAGIDTGEYDADSSMDELEELAKTAGAETIVRIIQKRPSMDSATVLGEGKIAEIRTGGRAQGYSRAQSRREGNRTIRRRK